MDKKKKKIIRIAKATDLGALGVVDDLNELEDVLDSFKEEVAQTTEILNSKVEEAIVIAQETQKMEGKKGEKGDKGDKGDKGLDGKDGVDGKNGLNGLDGKDGVDGKDGIDGSDGKDGVDGKDGKDGSPDTGEQIIKKINEDNTSLIDYEKIDPFFFDNKFNTLKKYVDSIPRGGGSVGGGSQNLQQVTDKGSTTTNPITVPRINHDTSYTPTGTEPTGSTYWDADNHTISTVLENGAILQHGFELYTYGTDEGNDFPEGSAVSVKGATGNRVAFELTDISDNESAINYIGLLTTPVDSGNRIATREGAVRNINTTGTPQGETWAEGDWIYVSSTPGGLTNVEPTTGRIIRVGTVTNRHATQGVIELDRLVVPTLQEVTDAGSTTDNTVTYTSSPTFTYSDGKLTNITYTNGVQKDFIYNLDGTLDIITITYPDSSTVIKTLVWSSGVLQSINII